MPVTESAVRPRKSRFAFRVVIFALVLLLLGFLGFDYWFYRAVRASMPLRDGTIHLAGLTGPVIVTYDRRGVPNIVAANLPDLFFAQGYITARDRLFQIDLWRRIGTGKLAEAVGPSAIERDQLARAVRWRGSMEAEWSSYGPDTKRIAHAPPQPAIAAIPSTCRDSRSMPEKSLEDMLN